MVTLLSPLFFLILCYFIGCTMQNPTFLTFDWTLDPCSGGLESEPLDPQRSPHHLLFSFQLISFSNWALGHVIYHCLHHLTFFSILCFLKNALLGLIHLYPVPFSFLILAKFYLCVLPYNGWGWRRRISFCLFMTLLALDD